MIRFLRSLDPKLPRTVQTLQVGGLVSAFGNGMPIPFLGECIHGAVQAPLVSDLAEPRLLGRYMALSALSWQVGFALGPAVGGFLLSVSPLGTWLVWAALCMVGAALAVALERAIPSGIRRTPVAQPA